MEEEALQVQIEELKRKIEKEARRKAEEEAKKTEEAAKEAEEVVRVRRETEALRRLEAQRAAVGSSWAREPSEEPEGQRKTAVQEQVCNRYLKWELECVSQMG